MADDFVEKSIKKQLFGEPAGRRSANSTLRGAERRAAVPRRVTPFRREWKDNPAPLATGEQRMPGARRGVQGFPKEGRRSTDVHIKSFDRAERTALGSAARAETEIVSAPVVRKLATKASGTIGESSSILRKAGRLGKIAAAGIAAYGAYKALKGE